MKKIDRALNKTTLWLCYAGCALMFITFLSLILNVFMRLLFNSAFYYNMEIVQFCLLFGICLMVPRTTYFRQHIRVTMFLGYLPSKLHRFVNIVMYLIAGVAFILIGYCLINAMSSETIRVQHTDVMKIPLLWIYCAMAVSFILSSLCFIFQMLTEVSSFNTEIMKISEVEKIRSELELSEQEK